MRHRKHTFKIGRTGSHKRCMMANMLKELIIRGRLQTTVRKAKELKRHADRMITLAKKDTLASRRLAINRLMVNFNYLTPKQQRLAKEGNISSYNTDRRVMNILFGELKKRFENRQGGYTRIIKKNHRVGDNSEMCFIEYLE